MENKNTNIGLKESNLIIAGEMTESASIKEISKIFGGELPQDGNIYYQKISENCLALISSVDLFIGNRVIGIGLDEKVTDSLIKDIKNFYKENNKNKFFIQASPVENNTIIRDLILQNGGEHRSNWAKLVKIPEAKKINNSDISIRELHEQDYEYVASLLLRSFSFPEELRPFCIYAFGKPGWTNYVAMLDDKIAGTGSLFIRDGIAEIGIAATVEDARGKGVQSALIHYRENIAFEKGCRYLYVETAEPTDTAPSYRNMIRLGFTELYRRPNYIFTL